MLFRNFPSPICMTSNICLILAGSLTSFWNSLRFHSEALHTSWASAAWGAPPDRPSVVKPAAAPEISDLRVMLFMFSHCNEGLVCHRRHRLRIYLNRTLAIIPLSS